jgi:hypothetical protein
MPSDFEKADKFIGHFIMLNLNHGKKSKAFWSEVWNVVKDVASIWEQSRMLNALPSDYSQIGAIMNDGGTARQDFNRSIREISWLEENGQCMDNIKVGQSENPDSGRGAFANRFIPQGGLVAPAPLIHIDSNVLKMYKPMDADRPGREVPDMDGPQTFQLLLNYCFGHEKSTLLLCPYGLLTAYINHSAENPNAKIEWSKTMRHPEWLDQPIKLWEDEYHTGFQIDFVALRDIQEEEEILIDYGEAWERAWQEHVRNFVPRENYTPAYELNDMEDLVYRTIEDRPYELDAVKLWCNAWYVNRFIKSRFKPFRDMECRILKRLGEDRYVVQVVEYENDDVEGTTTLETKGILWDVPSDAFYLADMGYERDHLQFDAFRHAMMIPDEVFPEVWKTL